jgi:hypothetical protein
MNGESNGRITCIPRIIVLIPKAISPEKYASLLWKSSDQAC